jgi:hypothetical protein
MLWLTWLGSNMGNKSSGLLCTSAATRAVNALAYMDETTLIGLILMYVASPKVAKASTAMSPGNPY